MDIGDSIPIVLFKAVAGIIFLASSVLSVDRKFSMTRRVLRFVVLQFRSVLPVSRDNKASLVNADMRFFPRRSQREKESGRKEEGWCSCLL